MAMTQRNQIYKCNHCGHIVTVLNKGALPLVCCGHPMEYLEENTVDAAREKHVPVIEKIANGYKVKVGSVAHPMTAEHYIAWIELHAGKQVFTQFLEPGEAPEAVFNTNAQSVIAKAYCNLHGNWKSN